MKLKIKVKVLTPGCEPQVNKKGDWIDLKVAKDIHMAAPYANTLKKHNTNSVRNVEFNNEVIPLGVAMQLPAGCEALVVPRSSTYKNFGIIQPNHVGIIDNSYSGNGDQWHMLAVALRDVKIDSLSRICQFKIQLSQKATLWQKIKYWLSSGIELVYVDKLNNPDRGGLGHSGVK